MYENFFLECANYIQFCYTHTHTHGPNERAGPRAKFCGTINLREFFRDED